MTITYKNYEIEVGESSFDLYQTRPPKQNHKKNTSEEVRCILGYFSKLPNCIQKIIMVDLSTRDEKIDLRNFLELYRSVSDDIQGILQ